MPGQPWQGVWDMEMEMGYCSQGWGVGVSDQLGVGKEGSRGGSLLPNSVRTCGYRHRGASSWGSPQSFSGKDRRLDGSLASSLSLLRCPWGPGVHIVGTLAPSKTPLKRGQGHSPALPCRVRLGRHRECCLLPKSTCWHCGAS